jgi:hypothetical protein
MNYPSCTSPEVSAVEKTVGQIAVMAGKVIWAIPYLVAVAGGTILVGPFWLGEKIGSFLRERF